MRLHVSFSMILNRDLFQIMDALNLISSQELLMSNFQLQ